MSASRVAPRKEKINMKKINMKKINVNNITFKVLNTRTNKVRFNIAERTAGRGLSYYYNRPSVTKQNIFAMWSNWARNTDTQGIADIRDFGISSANCQQFTLAFNMRYEGKWYSCKITPYDNYAYLIE